MRRGRGRAVLARRETLAGLKWDGMDWDGMIDAEVGRERKEHVMGVRG